MNEITEILKLCTKVNRLECEGNAKDREIASLKLGAETWKSKLSELEEKVAKLDVTLRDLKRLNIDNSHRTRELELMREQGPGFRR